VATPTATRSVRRPRSPAAPEPSTREQILDAAERLFSRRGVDGVAVRDLARATGLTASSLYNHFPSKQALYDAVIERDLRPVMDIVAAAVRPGALDRESVRVTLDQLVSHLAKRPHFAGLLQRALLEDSTVIQDLMARSLGGLYREGVEVVRRTAPAAGWDPSEVPHLSVALFGLIFGYFTNATAVKRMGGWGDDPWSPRALVTQRRFLEKAIVRLLGPRPRAASKRRVPTRQHERTMLNGGRNR
jgi:AcrR family transcriptional regulator